MVMTTTMMIVHHHLEVMVTIENAKRSRRRKSEAVRRKITKRKRVERGIESIIRLIVNHLKRKRIENEKTRNVEAMTTPPMMDRMMMKRGGVTNVNDPENVMILIVVLQTHPEAMIERKAKRERNTNQSLPNDDNFHFFNDMTYIYYNIRPSKNHELL